jgi:hypothetical protein
MATTTKPARSGPLRWVQIGRGRRLAIGVAAGLVAFACVSIYRIRSLNGLPDIGDPFDVAAALRPIEIPDEQNAYVVYASAHPGRFQFPTALEGVDFKPLTWSKARPEVRAFVEQKRPAMEKWRVGSERPDALALQPRDYLARGLTIPQVTLDMFDLTRLAGLEGSRLEEAGAMSQAWDWYRAMLRFSRLVVRHRGPRYIGAEVHEHATSRILRWAADPRVDARQLRKALDDTLAADALTPPLSESYELFYLQLVQPDIVRFLKDYGRPVPPLPGGEDGPLNQLADLARVNLPVRLAWHRATNDVERSRRIVRLLFANWRAQADRPAGQRAPVAIQDPVWIYAADPTTPPSAHAVAPEVLAEAIKQNAFARTLLFLDRPELAMFRSPPGERNDNLGRERRRRSVLIVRLAAELYRREHGAIPAMAGALLGPYLKELPEGIAPADPIPAGVD